MTNELTATQATLLTQLRKVRDAGEATVEARSAQAIGGLTAFERFAHGAVIPAGNYVAGCGYAGIGVQGIRIPGCNILTYHALAKLGLVVCDRGFWRATPNDDVLDAVKASIARA